MAITDSILPLLQKGTTAGQSQVAPQVPNRPFSFGDILKTMGNVPSLIGPGAAITGAKFLGSQLLGDLGMPQMAGAIAPSIPGMPNQSGGVLSFVGDLLDRLFGLDSKSRARSGLARAAQRGLGSYADVGLGRRGGGGLASGRRGGGSTVSGPRSGPAGGGAFGGMGGVGHTGV